MHPTHAVVPLLLLLATGCAQNGVIGWPGEGDTATLRDSGSPNPGGEWTGQPEFRVDWHDDSITLWIVGGSGGYNFGIIETPSDGSCGEYCWTGEDCAFGWTDPQTFEIRGPFCHTVEDGATDLAFFGDPDELDAGQTVFWSADYAEVVAYYVRAHDSEQCWFGGPQPTNRWQDMGCTEAQFDWEVL